MKKWGMILKVLGIVSIVLLAKIVVEFFNLDVIEITPLITAFVSGVIFILAFLLAGTLTDYKEAERIPGELATSIKTLYKDTRIACTNKEVDAGVPKCHVKQLLNIINFNFGSNIWKQKKVNVVMDALDDDIIELTERGVAPQFIVKLRNELTNIDRISNRIEIIKETTFVPAKHYIIP